MPALWKERVVSLLLEQRVATGQQNYIQSCVVHDTKASLHFVDADAEPKDRAGRTQALERSKPPAVRQCLEMKRVFRAMRHRTDVVDIEDIDSGQAQALQAVLVGAKNAIVAVVELGLKRHGGSKAMTHLIVGNGAIGR